MTVISVLAMIATGLFFWFSGIGQGKNGHLPILPTVAGMISLLIGSLCIVLSGPIFFAGGYDTAKADLMLSYSVENHFELDAGDDFSHSLIEAVSKDGTLHFSSYIESVLTEHVKKYPLIKYYEGIIWEPINITGYPTSGVFQVDRVINNDLYTAKWQIDIVLDQNQKGIPGVLHFKCDITLKSAPIISLNQEPELIPSSE